MEHFQYLIVDPNVTHKNKKRIFWAFYYNNIFKLLDVCPNLTYFKKTLKFINMFHILKEQDHKSRIT